jgi:hypothetical protein
MVLEYMRLGSLLSAKYFKETFLKTDRQKYNLIFDLEGNLKNKNLLPKRLD